jgi:hypothetical protein
VWFHDCRVAAVDAAADMAAGSTADGMRGLAGSSSSKEGAGSKQGAAGKQDMVWGPLVPAGEAVAWWPADVCINR